MRTSKANPSTDRRSAVRALKQAVVEGATWRFDHLVAQAVGAGVTDDEIAKAAHEALEALLSGAERPLTAQQLAHDWVGGHFRQ
jgi:hypothetical protein